MKLVFLVMILSSGLCSAQVLRFTKASNVFDVVVDPVACAEDKKCGPIKITVFRKGVGKAVQTMSGGRILGSDLNNAVQFVDFNFDGSKDLIVFDGFTAPGGNFTAARRIYLYSPKTKQFEFSSELSSLSRDESMDASELDKKKKLIKTYARIGSGVFQWRSYAMKKDKPVLVEEVVSDSQVDDGATTLITTRKLINGRWREWTKRTKTIFNQSKRHNLANLERAQTKVFV